MLIRRKTSSFVTALLLILSARSASSQTTIEGGFIHDVISRNYRAYIPAIYNPATPVPLLFNLHGYGSNNIEQEQYGDFRPIADTANFIIIHPNGTFASPGIRFWNTFGGATVDDVGFLSRLIDTLSARYNIDPNRIYSTGMSNGGFMSYDLACMLSTRIAAVASVTGSMIWTRLTSCNAVHPTPVMQIHGTADGTVAYNGNILFAPIDTIVRYWVRRNNCIQNPSIIPIPNINTQDGCTAERHIFSGGIAGSRVELYKVTGGGHSWPGAPINLNVTCMDFSASVVIWRFLREFRLNQLSSGIAETGSKTLVFRVYPNPGNGPTTIKFQTQAPRSFTITNYMGQVVQQRKINDNIAELNLPGKGMYFITVRQGNLVRTEKVIRL